jgi:hypothetical protein
VSNPVLQQYTDCPWLRVGVLWATCADKPRHTQERRSVSSFLVYYTYYSGSLVSIVRKLLAVRTMRLGSIPNTSKNFSSSQNVGNVSGAHSDSSIMRTGALSPMVKRTEREADHSIQCRSLEYVVYTYLHSPTRLHAVNMDDFTSARHHKL